MQLARVIGTVVANHKVEDLDGIKLLVIDLLDHDLIPVGEYQVAVDTCMAGPGDIVHTATSREASLALERWFVPVDSAIVGIVDQVDV